MGRGGTWRPQTLQADTFKRLGGRQWLGSAEHRSELSRHIQLSYNQVYKLRKHKQQVAAPVYFSGAITNWQDWSETVVQVPSVSATSPGIAHGAVQHLSCPHGTNVKVKWSRYRPSVAQMVGRGITLLFHDSGTGRGWVFSSTPRPHFNPGKDPVPTV